MKKIQDEFTDLNVSRQRKHQLRNPEYAKKNNKKYRQSEKGKKSIAKTMKRWREKNREWYLEYLRQYRIKTNL